MATLNNLLVTGGSKFLQGLKSNGTISVDAGASGNMGVIHLGNAAHKFCMHVSAGNTVGLYDQTYDKWMLSCDSSGNVIYAGGSVSGSLTIPTTEAANRFLRTYNSKQDLAFGVWGDGTAGIWDYKNNKWLIKSDASYNITLNGNANNVTVADGTSKNTWYRIVHGGTSGLFSTGSAQILDNESGTATKNTYLVLGNDTATGTSGNKRGILRLYDEGTHDVNFMCRGSRTGERWYTMPFIDSDAWITGYASNWDITRPASYTVYRVPICDGSQGRLSTDSSYFIEIRKGTTSQQGNIKLMLGNTIAEGTNGNMRGGLRLYAQDNTYAEINGTTGSGLYVTENATAKAILRNIQISRTDLTAGSSALTNGYVYLVYE